MHEKAMISSLRLMLYSSIRKLTKKIANQTPPTIFGSMPAKIFQPDSCRNIRIEASTATSIVGT